MVSCIEIIDYDKKLSEINFNIENLEYNLGELNNSINLNQNMKNQYYYDSTNFFNLKSQAFACNDHFSFQYYDNLYNQAINCHNQSDFTLNILNSKKETLIAELENESMSYEELEQKKYDSQVFGEVKNTLDFVINLIDLNVFNKMSEEKIIEQIKEVKVKKLKVKQNILKILIKDKHNKYIKKKEVTRLIENFSQVHIENINKKIKYQKIRKEKKKRKKIKEKEKRTKKNVIKLIIKKKYNKYLKKNEVRRVIKKFSKIHIKNIHMKIKYQKTRKENKKIRKQKEKEERGKTNFIKSIIYENVDKIIKVNKNNKTIFIKKEESKSDNYSNLLSESPTSIKDDKVFLQKKRKKKKKKKKKNKNIIDNDLKLINDQIKINQKENIVDDSKIYKIRKRELMDKWQNLNKDEYELSKDLKYTVKIFIPTEYWLPFKVNGKTYKSIIPYNKKNRKFTVFESKFGKKLFMYIVLGEIEDLKNSIRLMIQLPDYIKDSGLEMVVPMSNKEFKNQGKIIKYTFNLLLFNNNFDPMKTIDLKLENHTKFDSSCNIIDESIKKIDIAIERGRKMISMIMKSKFYNQEVNRHIIKNFIDIHNFFKKQKELIKKESPKIEVSELLKKYEFNKLVYHNIQTMRSFNTIKDFKVNMHVMRRLYKLLLNKYNLYCSKTNEGEKLHSALIKMIDELMKFPFVKYHETCDVVQKFLIVKIFVKSAEKELIDSAIELEIILDLIIKELGGTLLAVYPYINNEYLKKTMTFTYLESIDNETITDIKYEKILNTLRIACSNYRKLYDKNEI